MKKEANKKLPRLKYKAEASAGPPYAGGYEGPWRASFQRAKQDINSFESVSTGSARITVAEVQDDEVFFYGVFISLKKIGVR